MSWSTPGGPCHTALPRSADGSRCRAARSSRRPRATKPTTQDRLGADARIGLEALDRFARDAAPEDALDVVEQLEFVDAHQRHGVAIDTGTPGPPDAMDVVLGDHRQLEVDDVRKRLDVEPAGGDFGGHQDREATGLEIGQGPNALRLALVAVDRRGGDPVLVELLREAVGPVLGPGEDERLVDPAAGHEVAQQFALALTVDHVDDVRDELGRRIARRDLDRGRVVEQAVRQAPDLVRERGREEQVLAACRKHGEDLADVADEAHVEHPVGLIEDEDLDPGEVDGPLAEVIEQAAGGGHDDLRAGSQRTHLRVEADAAVDRGRADGVLGAVGPDAFLDLERELTGRSKDQRADDPWTGWTRGVEPLDERQHEGGRLAGPGLGAGEDVTSLQHERDGLALDRRGFGVALAGDSAEQLGRQPETIE